MDNILTVEAMFKSNDGKCVITENIGIGAMSLYVAWDSKDIYYTKIFLSCGNEPHCSLMDITEQVKSSLDGIRSCDNENRALILFEEVMDLFKINK